MTAEQDYKCQLYAIIEHCRKIRSNYQHHSKLVSAMESIQNLCYKHIESAEITPNVNDAIVDRLDKIIDLLDNNKLVEHICAVKGCNIRYLADKNQRECGRCSAIPII